MINKKNQNNEDVEVGVTKVDVIEVEEDDAIDLSTFRPVKSKSRSKVASAAGVLTIVNSNSNGRRLCFPKDVINKLGNPETLQVAINDYGIAVGADIADHETSFPVRKSGSKLIIYAGGLVKEIQEAFNLDFSDKVSMTFHQIKYTKNGEHPVAVIKVK